VTEDFRALLGNKPGTSDRRIYNVILDVSGIKQSLPGWALVRYQQDRVRALAGKTTSFGRLTVWFLVVQ
jgi:hypothetical protein